MFWDLAKLVLLALIVMVSAPRVIQFALDTTWAAAWSTFDLGRTALQMSLRNALYITGVVLAFIALFMSMGVSFLTVIPIITISLVVMVPIGLFGIKPSKWVWIGCAMYTASYFIANSWNIAFWMLDPLPVEIADAMKAIMKDAPANAYGFALRIDQANKRLLVAMYAGIVFFALRGDPQARFVWMILAIAETFSLLENVECKMLKDPFGSQDLHIATIWGIEVSKYACGRVFGSLSPYAPPIVTSLYLIYINVRKSHDNRPSAGG